MGHEISIMGMCILLAFIPSIMLQAVPGRCSDIVRRLRWWPGRLQPLDMEVDEDGSGADMTRDVSDDMRAGWARTVLAVDGIGRFAAAGVVLASDKVLRRADPSLKSRLPLAGVRLTTSALLLRGAARKRPRSKDLLCAATVNLGWVLACTTSHRSTPTQAGDNSWPPPPFSMGPVVGCSGNWVGTHPEKNEFHPVRALARGAGRKPLTHPLSGRKR